MGVIGSYAPPRREPSLDLSIELYTRSVVLGVITSDGAFFFEFGIKNFEIVFELVKSPAPYEISFIIGFCCISD